MNKRDSDGRTPLYIALKVHGLHTEQKRENKVEIAALLRGAGAQEPTALELQQMEQEIAQENADFEEGSEEDPEEESEEESEESEED